MKRLKLTLILLLGIGVYNGYAQASLSLQEALKFALQNNQQLAKTKLDEEMGKFKTQEVRSQALPQINGTGDYTDNLQLAKSILPGDAIGKPGENVVIGFGVKFATSVGAELRQQVYNQSVFTGLKAAKAGEEYYKLATQQSTEDVIYNVTQQYFQLLITQENLKSLDSNIVKLTELVSTTKSQFDNGLAKKIDLDRIKVNLTNSQTKRIQTLNEYAIKANNLKKVMGMPMESAFTIPATSLKDIESSAATVLQYEDINMEDRTELQVLRKQEELQEFQKKANQAENYPSLSVFGRYSYSGMSNQWLFAKDPVNSTLWYGTSAIGISLKIPIFDGFGRRAKVGQADVTLRQLRHTMSDTKLSLNNQYENAKLTMRTNITAINSQKENMELANEVYYSTENNYRLGLASLTDLLNAETSLTDAQNSYNSALLQYKLAELDIIKGKGSLKNLLN